MHCGFWCLFDLCISTTSTGRLGCCTCLQRLLQNWSNKKRFVSPVPLNQVPVPERCSFLLQSCLSVGKNVMTLDSVSNVVFYGILADCSRSTAVKATNCKWHLQCFGNLLHDPSSVFCAVAGKNVWFVPFGVERTGGSGIEVSGMGNKLVVSVSNTACGGVHLSGGDQVCTLVEQPPLLLKLHDVHGRVDLTSHDQAGSLALCIH